MIWKSAAANRPSVCLYGMLSSRSLVPRLFPHLLPLLLPLLLLSGCGGDSAPPSPPAVSDSAQVVFAGRPLNIPLLPCASAILIESRTNQILYEQNAHERRAPASIAKMTLELVVMQEIESGRLALTDSIEASAWASKIGGSQVYLAEGEIYPLEDLMKAIAIHSANDACVAVSERIAGTADGFVQMMNQEVEALGLTDTHYVNVHGLDDEPGVGNYTTAYDISQIGRALVRFPHILEWSSTIQAPFRDGQFLLDNTNHLLGHFSGLDGLKTGYTLKAGFCLCGTAQRNGFRLISVILGAGSNRQRFDDTARLLASGFNGYATMEICRKGDPLGDPVPVRGGRQKTIQAIAPRDFVVVVSRPDDRKLEKKLVPAPKVQAPLSVGAPIGTYRVSTGGTMLAEIPVVAAQDVAAKGLGAWLRRIFSRG